MKRNTILALLFTILVLIPRPAAALPISWRGSKVVTQAGVTYRVRDKDRAAVVVRVHKSRATIPAEIRHRGKWYEVRAIWPGALRGVKSMTIHADLETCEDARLWKIPVRVTRAGMYRWLHRTGAAVKLIHCEGCK
jgi:hypothetical protein